MLRCAMRVMRKLFLLFRSGLDKASSLEPSLDYDIRGLATAPPPAKSDLSTIRKQLRAAVIEEEVAWLAALSEKDPRLDYGTIYALIVRLHERRL
jgi:hypothetical protein|tara:strand:+ start:600 stop:884 length:285 start_codon:yes stop_codon:yes gene_type:complete